MIPARHAVQTTVGGTMLITLEEYGNVIMSAKFPYMKVPNLIIYTYFKESILLQSVHQDISFNFIMQYQ